MGSDTFSVESDVNVLFSNVRRRTTDYRVRNNYRTGRGRRNASGGRARGKRKACWECGKLDHFVRDRHSREDMDRAFAQGQSVAAFCAIVPPDLASVVMAVELEADAESVDDMFIRKIG